MVLRGDRIRDRLQNTVNYRVNRGKRDRKHRNHQRGDNKQQGSQNADPCWPFVLLAPTVLATSRQDSTPRDRVPHLETWTNPG